MIHARVSIDGYADDGVSIGTQLKAFRRWCRQGGVETVGGHNNDCVSGTINNCDDFGQLTGAVVSKHGDKGSDIAETSFPTVAWELV